MQNWASTHQYPCVQKKGIENNTQWGIDAPVPMCTEKGNDSNTEWGIDAPVHMRTEKGIVEIPCIQKKASNKQVGIAVDNFVGADGNLDENTKWCIRVRLRAKAPGCNRRNN